MNPPIPAAITVREVLHGGGARYELPRRPLGPLRWFGLLPLGFGAFICLFAVGWMLAAAAIGDGWFGWIFALWGLPFFIGGLSPVAIGLFMLIGRCEIELRDGALHTTERAGPFHWSRRQPVNAVKRFNIRTADSANAPAFLGGLAALDADCGKPKPFLIAIGYPREWLQALGDDLARCCNLAAPGRVFGAGKLTVETVTEPLRPPQPVAQEEDLNQPAGSNITLEPQADGFTLHVPPAGLWRGNKGLIIFGVIWWAVAAAITGLVTVFVVGIAGVLALAARLGRRQATIHATSDRLRIAYVGFFRSHTLDWPQAGLAAICVGPSGVEVNHKPVLELQIHPLAGRKFGFLADRDAAELQWVAAILRQALGASPTPPTAGGGPRKNG
jgi:hypothetical protein